MIPTLATGEWKGGLRSEFQSRNRETYDSNFPVHNPLCRVLTRFNLVIEKLMIPT